MKVLDGVKQIEAKTAEYINKIRNVPDKDKIKLFKEYHSYINYVIYQIQKDLKYK